MEESRDISLLNDIRDNINTHTYTEIYTNQWDYDDDTNNNDVGRWNLSTNSDFYIATNIYNIKTENKSIKTY